MSINATPEAVEALEAMFVKFVNVLMVDSATPPSLYLVIVEAPTPGLIPDEFPPLDPTRPPLAGKSWLHRSRGCDQIGDIIPTEPARRILYRGDAGYLELFHDLGRQAVELLRTLDPDIRAWLIGAGNDELATVSNLWPVLVRDLGEMTGAGIGFMERWRWSDHQWCPLLPYDDADMQIRIDADKARGAKPLVVPSKDRNVTVIVPDAFTASASALQWLTERTRSQLPIGPPREEDLPGLMRRAKTFYPKVVALVEFMIGRDEATFEEVKADVMEDTQNTDDAVEKLARKANKTLEEFRSPIRYRSRGRRVLKEVSPPV